MPSLVRPSLWHWYEISSPRDYRVPARIVVFEVNRITGETKERFAFSHANTHTIRAVVAIVSRLRVLDDSGS